MSCAAAPGASDARTARKAGAARRPGPTVGRRVPVGLDTGGMTHSAVVGSAPRFERRRSRIRRYSAGWWWRSSSREMRPFSQHAAHREDPGAQVDVVHVPDDDREEGERRLEAVDHAAHVEGPRRRPAEEPARPPEDQPGEDHHQVAPQHGGVLELLDQAVAPQRGALAAGEPRVAVEEAAQRAPAREPGQEAQAEHRLLQEQHDVARCRQHHHEPAPRRAGREQHAQVPERQADQADRPDAVQLAAQQVAALEVDQRAHEAALVQEHRQAGHDQQQERADQQPVLDPPAARHALEGLVGADQALLVGPGVRADVLGLGRPPAEPDPDAAEEVEQDEQHERADHRRDQDGVDRPHDPGDEVALAVDDRVHRHAREGRAGVGVAAAAGRLEVGRVDPRARVARRVDLVEAVAGGAVRHPAGSRRSRRCRGRTRSRRSGSCC